MLLPNISVILPVRNEEKYITACVESIFAQDYPAEKMEVIFVDGCSEDRTVAMLHEMREAHPQIVVLDNPKRTVPYAMNIGIRASTADIIVRLDAHAEYPSDYIRLSVETLLTVDCDNAGGVCETRGKGFMGDAIAAMLATPLGVGNSSFRIANEDKYVDTVPFGCWRKALFDRIGGFDERMTRNQDNELNHRIRKNGGKIYMNHNIKVIYYCRDTIPGIMKMGFQNGTWNVITMTLVPGSMGVRHFVPLAFVLSTILLALLTLITRSWLFGGLLLLEWGAYMLLDVFYAYTIAKEKDWRYFPIEVILYPLFHFAYGFGSLRGITLLPKFLKEEKAKAEKAAQQDGKKEPKA